MTIELKIFDEKEKDKIDFSLQLKKEGDSILLCAVDEYGDLIGAGRLLAIHADGTLHLGGNINPDLGLPLDDKGRIKTCDHDSSARKHIKDMMARHPFNMFMR